MADDPVVTKALEKILFHQSEAARLKRWVNDYDEMSGAEPRFGDVETATTTASVVGSRRTPKQFQPGEFLGKPFATAVRVIMEARAEAAGNSPSPVSVEDIQEALIQGAFDFGTTNSESQKQSIRISLGKNTVTFVRIPNTDLFGLLEWYPGLRKAGKPRKNGEKDQAASSTADNTDSVEGGSEEAAASPAAPNDIMG
ncbi:hypothetical protein ABIF38_001741 [Bradyrhizobium japonicum]|uniref:hypothetical protein n=1 Tax=Bradyrhizobium TaxID=374 RepID=UPI0003754BBB|nr:hypothetical protein [Bradyrhizobium elkanii]MCP1735943.1 hypothetical protein [Bradyrhizobium elkanii]MCS3571284.1 hypothetical protein [Bradyrhizobium elkanii]MCS3587233.1 hypothetical protein [Bradyrhizobium elkanii]MCS3625467.1 hypothetical protein [Bradyrhizobium elkanii]MCS3687479.1 hypothetical protein [Bradyrhizobium elkanii]